MGEAFTIPNAIVFALVLGWPFMNRRGTESPIAATAITIWTMWSQNLKRGSNTGLSKKAIAGFLDQDFVVVFGWKEEWKQVIACIAKSVRLCLKWQKDEGNMKDTHG